MNRLRIVALTLALAAGEAFGFSFGFEQMSCPIDGSSFQAQVAKAGTVYGHYLDGRPYGLVLSPEPLPRCPQGGFVVYRTDFTPREAERLRVFVQSGRYRSVSRESAYFIAASAAQFIGEEPRRVAHLYLRATWEVEDAPDPARFAAYAARAVKAFDAALSRPYADDDEFIVDQLAAADLERRTGQFEAARKRLERLESRVGERVELYRPSLDTELQLLERKELRRQ